MGNLLSDFFCTCDTYKIKSKHTSNGIHKQATEAVYEPVYTFHTARERELRLAEFSLSQQGSCQCPYLAITRYGHLVFQQADSLWHQAIFWDLVSEKSTFDQIQHFQKPALLPFQQVHTTYCRPFSSCQTKNTFRIRQQLTSLHTIQSKNKWKIM